MWFTRCYYKTRIIGKETRKMQRDKRTGCQDRYHVDDSI